MRVFVSAGRLVNDFKAEGIGGIRCMGVTPQKKMKRLSSEADMRHIVFTGNN
jgi:hypothetical protein